MISGNLGWRCDMRCGIPVCWLSIPTAWYAHSPPSTAKKHYNTTRATCQCKASGKICPSLQESELAVGPRQVGMAWRPGHFNLWEMNVKHACSYKKGKRLSRNYIDINESLFACSQQGWYFNWDEHASSLPRIGGSKGSGTYISIE